jgi:hypothetical protein
VLIERAKICGAETQALADHHKVSADAIYRHMRNHVTAETRQAYISQDGLRRLAEQAAADGLSTLQRYQVAVGQLQNQLLQASDRNDARDIAALSRALFDGLRDVSKLTGEALEHVGKISLVQNNFYSSPDYLALQGMLVEALTPYPEALRAVLTGLEALESPPASDPKLIEGAVIE